MVDLTDEIRRFPASDPGSNPIHIGVVYPNTYPVAVASLGFQTVHLTAYPHPGVVTHRVVLESEDGIEYPSRTLEESLNIKSLSALLISCSFELDYLHLVRILDESGIPVLRENRGSYPLIIVGGVAPTANPEPLALIADAISIGDGEVIIPGLLDDLQEAWPLLQGARFLPGRDKLYELWHKRVGVYVPSLHGKNGFDREVKQAAVENLEEYPSYTPIVSPKGVYGAKNLIAVSSGCAANCRFCLLSYVYPAGPSRSFENIIDNAHRFSPDEASVGLISSRVSDHPEFTSVVNSLAAEGYEVSVSSLRIASTSDAKLESLVRAGAKSVTFAPEHGSEKIREIINKPYTYNEVMSRVSWAFNAGISRVKLYFLTGFKEETGSDLDATAEFIHALTDDVKLTDHPAHFKLIIGLAPFVPKASTPFQNRAMEDEKVLKKKMKRIVDALTGHPRIDIETESPRTSIIQGTLSVADRSVGKHLEYIAGTRGPIYASWDDALRRSGDEPKLKVMQDRTKSESPWNFIRRPKSRIEHD